ncbi:hypothetical protein ANN_07009 [Periplaneta americana]|uniref:Flavoprotein domain-containing protein n=1 Tax=Periplaneta americana TaxID=6978 RepID=A0ABQ8TG07_PERAM|nr:hypothetical protein ANN_07009 [Periplaneta americana]
MDSASNGIEKHILVACTGSVATIKLPVLLKTILESGDTLPWNIKLKVIVTKHAKHFYSSEDIPTEVSVYCDEDEWTTWTKRGDPVLHIELAKWADICVISPLDANTLAKLAQGLCDNLLTCVARAWDPKKPLLFCPAMNTQMWEHPATATHITTLKTWGYMEVPCIAKTLMCGDTGLGAMAEVPTIVDTIFEVLGVDTC